MIIYATRQTIERFKLKLPEEMSDPIIGAMARAVIDAEQGDRLLEWGAKLFYFDRRKCMQVVNFASKLTFFLIDIKLDDLPDIGNLITQYLQELYGGDRVTTRLLKRLYEESPAIAFSSLKDRGIIANLNHTQTYYLEDGYRLYDYISDGILHSRKINRDINEKWYFTEKLNGKTEYFNSSKRFAELLRARYEA